MSMTCWLVRRERYVRLRATVSGSSGGTRNGSNKDQERGTRCFVTLLVGRVVRLDWICGGHLLKLYSSCTVASKPVRPPLTISNSVVFPHQL